MPTTQRHVPRHQARKRARDTSQPRCCPYCRRNFTGEALIKHLKMAHNAKMCLQKDASTAPAR